MSDVIFINLGIDFGTRFTKVCARSEEVGTVVCDFSGQAIEGALLSSVVTLALDGTLEIPKAGHLPHPDTSIGYLKMAVAERGQLRVGANLRGYVQEREGLAEGLSAFFLSVVMRRARRWVESTWARHIGGRQIIWSANVGLPVQHCDAPVADTFQWVLATAWRWSGQPPRHRILGHVAEDYLRDCDLEDPARSECQAYPEIAAAVLSFATSRSAAEGVYVYFDVGGGTLDGVVFALKRPRGEVEINFYSGEVASLGVEWLAGELLGNRGHARDDVEQLSQIRDIILAPEFDSMDAEFEPLTTKVQVLVSRVVSKGKRKDPGDWRETALQRHPKVRTLRRATSDSGLRPMRIFIGGGGMNSGFYQLALEGAYSARKMHQFGSPPLKLAEVPSPPGLDLRSIAPKDYHRFLIAFGLSVPPGEGPEFRLPSCFEDAEIKRPRESDIPDYQDHKAIYD